MDITLEFTLKNQSKTYITLMGWLLLPYMVTPITKRTSPLNSHQKPLRTYITLMGLPLLPYMVTPITKRTSPFNSHQKTTPEHIEHFFFATIAIYGHSDHKTDITIKFTWKNHFKTHRTLMCLLLLPYMVTLITKWTSPLNSHQKTTPEHIEPLCFCRYCHIWSLRSQNRHHH